MRLDFIGDRMLVNIKTMYAAVKKYVTYTRISLFD